MPTISVFNRFSRCLSQIEEPLKQQSRVPSGPLKVSLNGGTFLFIVLLVKRIGYSALLGGPC